MVTTPVGGVATTSPLFSGLGRHCLHRQLKSTDAVPEENEVSARVRRRIGRDPAAMLRDAPANRLTARSTTVLLLAIGSDIHGAPFWNRPFREWWMVCATAPGPAARNVARRSEARPPTREGLTYRAGGEELTR